MYNILVLATCESFLQPLAAAKVASVLAQLGHDVRIIDCTIDAIDDAHLASASAYFVTVPMFDSLKQACAIAAMLRDERGDKPLFFVGAYAELNRVFFENRYAGHVLAGNYDGALAAALEDASIPSLRTPDGRMPSWWCRTLLPDLVNYAYPGGLLPHKRVGNVETTTGCRFNCSHCTVYTLSRGNVNYCHVNDVMNEIDWLVDKGADHISFTDAEFMNESGHGPGIIEAFIARHPGITFDVISRVDRILKYADKFRRFSDLGCSFVTTALEFPDDKVLTKLRKGYRTKHLAALAELNEKGVRINPTLIVFSPWVDVAAIVKGEKFLADSGLADIIDPVQKVTRLLVVKGSPLLETKALDGIRLQEREFDYAWKHPIPEVDQMYTRRIEEVGIGAAGRCCVRC